MQRKVHRNKGPGGQKTLQKLHFQISRTGASGNGDLHHRHDDDFDDNHDGGDDDDNDDYGHFFPIWKQVEIPTVIIATIIGVKVKILMMIMAVMTFMIMCTFQIFGWKTSEMN